MGLLNNILKTNNDDKAAVKAEVNDEQKVVAKESVEVKKSADRKDVTVKNSDIKSKKSEKPDKEDTKNAYKVLISPLISEKAADGSKFNQYTFLVNTDSNKSEIKKAILAVYGVLPVKVNIIYAQGKKINFGKFRGKRKDWKKAIITLSKEEQIQIYEGI